MWLNLSREESIQKYCWMRVGDFRTSSLTSRCPPGRANCPAPWLPSLLPRMQKPGNSTDSMRQPTPTQTNRGMLDDDAIVEIIYYFQGLCDVFTHVSRRKCHWRMKEWRMKNEEWWVGLGQTAGRSDSSENDWPSDSGRSTAWKFEIRRRPLFLAIELEFAVNSSRIDPRSLINGRSSIFFEKKRLQNACVECEFLPYTAVYCSSHNCGETANHISLAG